MCRLPPPSLPPGPSKSVDVCVKQKKMPIPTLYPSRHIRKRPSSGQMQQYPQLGKVWPGLPSPLFPLGWVQFLYTPLDNYILQHAHWNYIVPPLYIKVLISYLSYFFPLRFLCLQISLFYQKMYHFRLFPENITVNIFFEYKNA